MRPECDISALHFFDDGMAQYSISSLLGDSIDSIKKAEFRQRTDSSAAKIKEIVSEIREDVTVMEQRKSRETTPTQKQQQLQQQQLLKIPPDVRPDPVRQREQALRNEELALRFSPARRYKELLEREKKIPKKAIVKRKFSLVHCLPDRPKKDTRHHFSPSSVPSHRLQSSPHHINFVQYHPPTPLPYSTVPHTPLPYPTVSASLPASPTSHSPFAPMLSH